MTETVDQSRADDARDRDAKRMPVALAAAVASAGVAVVSPVLGGVLFVGVLLYLLGSWYWRVRTTIGFSTARGKYETAEILMAVGLLVGAIAVGQLWVSDDWYSSMALFVGVAMFVGGLRWRSRIPCIPRRQAPPPADLDQDVAASGGVGLTAGIDRIQSERSRGAIPPSG